MTLNVRITAYFEHLRHVMKFFNYKHLAAVISSVTMTIFLERRASVPTHPIAQQIDQEMVLVEGGTFTMGSNLPKQAKPSDLHEI